MLVQDSVRLQRQHPTHPIWQHPLFLSPAYISYAQEALKASCEAVRPAELTLKQVLPELIDRLEVQHTKMISHFKSEIASVNTGLTTITDTIHKLTSGNAILQLPLKLNEDEVSNPSSLKTTKVASISPQYSMCRSISTVPDLWTEWSQGWYSKQSIVSLESTYGASWRKSDAERKFFFRRKRIIDAVKSMSASKRISIQQAVSLFEDHRRSHVLSLNSLLKHMPE